MKNYGSRIFLSIFWIVLGIVLCACHFAGLIEEYWSSMGFAFIVVGILQVIRQIRYRTNKDYQEKFDTEVYDERNRFLRNKAWAWAGYLFVLIAAVSTIVFKLMDMEECMMMASGSVCLLLVLYWVCFLILRKKY
ncbi:MAG: hypothetical protein E7429_03135 [Ruminococcaceae bacterium]|nr:hypothetical protein [Oscillospiraceae bacterium]